MAGKTLVVDHIMSKDDKACRIAEYWTEWNMARQPRIAAWEELRKYIFATDTRTTSNASLPWKNTTTIPKICQIRDNLYSYYMAALFPKRHSLEWEASEEQAMKRDSIIHAMRYALSQEYTKAEAAKIVLDYIDYGNAFLMPDWLDNRQLLTQPPVKVGYVGPTLRRVSPLDIVFNPIAPSFRESPKIIRSLVSIGELKKIIESQSMHEDKEAAQDLYDYIIEFRQSFRSEPTADLKVQDAYLQVDGFRDYRSYIESDTVEILTFYGDLFDWEKKELLPNYKIMVVDRHKIISEKPNPSYFGYPPIFQVGWRPRQDNLWAMGPLDNLVGLQYRLDHIENLKADIFDLLTFPPLKVRGYVEDFKWGPFEKIYVGEEGDVEIMAPPYQVLQANLEIQAIMALMEEMAGSPKEAMGFRTPGEKTAHEVQRLENAASRIFITRTRQLEEQGFEPAYNAMLELWRRNLDAAIAIPVFDDELRFQEFANLTPADITGAGRIKPVAARHFAEKAELVQNLTNFYSSAVGADPEIRMHLSSVETARMLEKTLGLEEWKVFQPYVRITEQADMQRLQNAAQEQVAMEAQTPSGLTPDDHDPEVDAVAEAPPLGMEFE